MADFSQKTPERRKNRPQQRAEGSFKKHTARPHGKIVGQTDVSPAEPEVQNQPAVEGGSQKQQVRKGCPFGPQGAQETVDRPEDRTHQKSVGQPQQARRCSRHRKNLPSLRSVRRCS